jgi:hypothetical protein
MVLNFCFDRMDWSDMIGYPNLASPNLASYDFDHVWPRTTPLRLLKYFDMAKVHSQSHTVTAAPRNSWYPVALAWHDFGCDYFSLMSDMLLDRVRKEEIRILFYYHEGDNPIQIKERLDILCSKHALPRHAYLFISGNTAADGLENFMYFPDHEYFFRYINRRQTTPEISISPRQFEFTALNRTHKWWRASCMTDLYLSGILDRSLWSYNTECTVDDREQDNPLELDLVPGWRDAVRNFVNNGPYFCDSGNANTHNDHRQVVTNLYQDSYCHLVLETLFDADNSGGTFITEKTYKAIKFGQPFVIIGTKHSLHLLRQQGYRVFDHAIDNSYDNIENNTDRWQALKNTIKQIRSQSMHQWFLRCLPDLEHNQKVFKEMTNPALNAIISRLSCKN